MEIKNNHCNKTSGTVAVPGKRTCDAAGLDKPKGLSNRPRLQRTLQARITEDEKLEETNVLVPRQELSDLKDTVPHKPAAWVSKRVQIIKSGGTPTALSFKTNSFERIDPAKAILLARQDNDVILYSSNSSTVPYILLSPPEGTNSQLTFPMNTTPLQDQAFGNALVVPSSDASRRMVYINVPLPADNPFITYLTFTDFKTASDFSEFDTESDSSWDSTDSEESSDDNSTPRPTSPIPGQLTFFSSLEYDNSSPVSTDLGYVFEPGYFSSYEIMDQYHGTVGDEAEFGDFFKDL